MRIWVNGTERPDVARRALSEDIIAIVENEAEQSGMAILSLFVDGVETTRESFRSLNLGEWETLNFKLVPFEDSLYKALKDTLASSRKLISSIESLADQLEHKGLPALSEDNTALPQIVKEMGFLLNAYGYHQAFTSMPFRRDEDDAFSIEVLNSLERLSQLHRMRNRVNQCEAIILCLRQEILPRAQWLECKFNALMNASRMPLQ